jgi:hypothetical protein
MIFVFALEKGLISRALSVGVFVLLGELELFDLSDSPSVAALVFSSYSTERARGH